MCDRRWICRDESLLNTLPQKRQACWALPSAAAAAAEPREELGCSRWSWETLWLGAGGVAKLTPLLCPNEREEVLEDFSWR